jgi:Peptidase A4 family
MIHGMDGLPRPPHASHVSRWYKNHKERTQASLQSLNCLHVYNVTRGDRVVQFASGSSSTSPRTRPGRRRAAVGVLSLAIVVSGGAAASPAASPAASSAVTWVGLVHALPRGAVHSDQTWAGYAVTGRDPYTKVTGSWTVPTMNCSHGRGDASPWVGIDGWSNDTVEQIGIDLDCYNGTGSYHPWVEMYPGPSDYFHETVHAGDTLTAAVSVSGRTWTLTESDTTAGWTRTFHRTPNHVLQRASAEAIVEDVGTGGAPPVPDFSKVTFDGITVDGTPLASAGTAHKTTLERGSTPLSQESSLSGGDFSITWLHN